MPQMMDILTWRPMPGCGEQLGEATIRLRALPRGLIIHRIAVFAAPGGGISFGLPLVPIGEHAGRYSAVDFEWGEDRARFCVALSRALLGVAPELGEPRS